MAYLLVQYSFFLVKDTIFVMIPAPTEQDIVFNRPAFLLLPTPTEQDIFAQLYSGDRWQNATITFSFPTTQNSLFTGNGQISGFTALLGTAQSAARLAISLWDDLILPDFVEIPSGANYLSSDLEFGMSTTGVPFAGAYYPSIGSVWFNANFGVNSGTNNLVSPPIGRHGFLTYVHEIGHALGLEHAGIYNGSGNWSPLNLHDSTVFSVMSYFGPNWRAGEGQVAWADWVGNDGILYSPQTPMLNDIFVMQRVYGAETTTRTGNTTYGFNSNITGVSGQIYDFTSNANPILTIYDAGGSDTLDLSRYSTPSVIKLTAGSFSSCNSMTNNIAIAYGCTIENAFGGSGNDQIYGNSGDNILIGGSGNDIIFGFDGNDTLVGGAGFDTVSYELSATAISVNLSLTSAQQTNGEGLDTLSEIEAVIGSRFSDNIIGNDLDNEFIGLSGNDLINGGAGTDTCYYLGVRANYTISALGNGSYRVTDNFGTDGTDTLTSIEFLLFSDGSMTLDNIGPAFTSATTSADGLKVILTYNEPLSATTAAKTAFAVKVAGVTATISSVAANGSTVELTLATSIGAGQAVTVGYTAPTASAATTNAAVQDRGGNDAVTLAATTAVTNISTADKTAPTVSTVTPTDGATGITVGSNIVLTFSEAIARGTGTITLRSGSATGTIIESFDAATSNRLNLSGSTLTIDPTSNLLANTQYFVVFTSGNIKDTAGNAYAGISTYDFRTANILNGTGNNDTLNGTVNADTINGLAGNDIITGGAGADSMTGGTGADTFVFGSRADTRAAAFAGTDTTAANIDKIVEFDGAGSAAGDIIQLSAAANVFGAALDFTVTTTATVTAVTVATAADFTALAAAMQAASAGVASTGAVAQVYDVTVTAGALAGRYVVINDETAGIAATDTFIQFQNPVVALVGTDFSFV
jgi:serralysin